MTTDTPLSPPEVRSAQRSPLRVSMYDKISALLVSSLLFMSLLATALFAIWLLTVVVFVRVMTPVVLYPGDNGVERIVETTGPEAPGFDELPVSAEQPVESVLQPVTNIATLVAAHMDDNGVIDALTGGGGIHGTDRRRRDPPIDVIPPWERWQIHYLSSDIEEYARQLDYFGIELAAAGGSKLVDYTFNHSQNPPSTRQGSGKEEDRIYLTWTSGKLRAFDVQLLQRAGIKTDGRIIMQFLPHAVCEELARLELAGANGRPPEQWQRTIFGVRRHGADYEFFVEEQTFRSSSTGGSAIDGSDALARLRIAPATQRSPRAVMAELRKRSQM